MTYKLRPYPSDLLDCHCPTVGTVAIGELPRGGGKMICFSHVLAEATAHGKKALVLAHRVELIKQAADKIAPSAGIDPGIIKAGYKADYSRSIQVASIHSLTRRLTKCPQFDLIVVDEAHYSTA